MSVNWKIFPFPNTAAVFKNKNKKINKNTPKSSVWYCSASPNT